MHIQIFIYRALSSSREHMYKTVNAKHRRQNAIFNAKVISHQTIHVSKLIHIQPPKER